MTESKQYPGIFEYPPYIGDLNRIIYSPIRTLLMSPSHSPPPLYPGYFPPSPQISPFFSGKNLFYNNRGSAIKTPVSNKNEISQRHIDFDKQQMSMEYQNIEYHAQGSYPFETYYNPEFENKQEINRLGNFIDTRGNQILSKVQDTFSTLLGDGYELPMASKNFKKEFEVQVKEEATTPFFPINSFVTHDRSQKKTNKFNNTNLSLAITKKIKDKAHCCNCKKTKCLKLYCECFSAGEICGPSCNCTSCDNRDESNELRAEAMEMILVRDPTAFTSKIKATNNNSAASHVKGCNCKKSNCLKKYCECFSAGIRCGDFCKCDECKNLTHDPSHKHDSEKSNSVTIQMSPKEPVELFGKGCPEGENSITTFRPDSESCQRGSSLKKSTPNRIKLYRGGGGHNQKKNIDFTKEKRSRESSSNENCDSPAVVKKIKGKKSDTNLADLEWTEQKLRHQSNLIKEFEGKMTPYSRMDAKKNLLDGFKTPVTKVGSDRSLRSTRSTKDCLSNTIRKRK